MVRAGRGGRGADPHVQGRFFIHRLQNVGATGLQRSWTDNILWHHTTHLVDIGLWMVAGGDMATAEDRIRNVYAAYPPIEPRTGIPMELVLVIETHDDQTILSNGSYYAHNRIYDVLARTDRDDYHVDELTSLITTAEGERPIPTEQENAELIAPEFVEAVRDGREPFVPGWSVLPAMRVLHRVQERVGRQARQAAHPRAAGRLTPSHPDQIARFDVARKDTRTAPQPPLVRREGHAVVRAPLPHRADGFRRRGLPGQAGDRDHQHLE